MKYTTEMQIIRKKTDLSYAEMNKLLSLIGRIREFVRGEPYTRRLTGMFRSALQASL